MFREFLTEVTYFIRLEFSRPEMHMMLLMCLVASFMARDGDYRAGGAVVAASILSYVGLTLIQAVTMGIRNFINAKFPASEQE